MKLILSALDFATARTFLGLHASKTAPPSGYILLVGVERVMEEVAAERARPSVWNSDHQTLGGPITLEIAALATEELIRL